MKELDNHQESSDPKPDVTEQLAEYAHGAWSRWMTYMFSKCQQNDDGTMTIPAWAVERWSRQAITEYVGLSDDEKASDQREASRMIAIHPTRD